MKTTKYNPVIHHRQSIRLKGHDYAGGGLYFVTICAHYNAGNIFAPESVKNMIAREWKTVGAGLVSATFISGFHSPLEKEILKKLLKTDAKIICCPAWGIDKMRIPGEWLPALEENRMMIMEMTNREGDLAASKERNRFVLQVSDHRWLPHVTPRWNA